ncbi:MAG: molybdopterin cofactor-binding domain-containing protein [Pseudomonadota bacterium]
MDVKQDFKVVGTRPIRPDGIEKVTGRARFGSDFVLPGMLQGKVLRSEHAHAKIKSIDTSEAEKVDGVKAVVTGDDFPALQSGMVEAGEAPTDQWDLARNVIARDKVLYHGHVVAAVAATSIAAAELAITKIKVEYEALTPVLDLETAMADNAPLLHDDLYTQGLAEKATTPSNIAAFMELKRGDIDVGFNEADVVVERTFTTSTVHQGYIEPHAVVAQTTENGKCEIWCCTQGPFEVHGGQALWFVGFRCWNQWTSPDVFNHVLVAVWHLAGLLSTVHV